MGLKRALSIRETCNNEIVYVESGRTPLSIRIAKQQLKFWLELQSYLEREPNHPLKGLVELGQELNIPYIQHYSKLKADYRTPHECTTISSQRLHNDIAEKIRTKANEDEESRLVVYLKVNPLLIHPLERPHRFEFERIVITRYRTGSHNLRVETGRLCNPTLPREERLCKCNTGVQTLTHYLFDCPLLNELRGEYVYSSVKEALELPDAATLMLKIEKELDIKNLSV